MCMYFNSTRGTQDSRNTQKTFARKSPLWMKFLSAKSDRESSQPPCTVQPALVRSEKGRNESGRPFWIRKREANFENKGNETETNSGGPWEGGRTTEGSQPVVKFSNEVRISRELWLHLRTITRPQWRCRLTGLSS